MFKDKSQFIKNFSGIRLRIASPEEIRRWSCGEVLRPETINYRTQKPEKDGLFSERIFGPTKDWECYCGKYKKIRYRGVVCDKCGVEVTKSSVRRERMGHIELAAPTAHLWFLRSIPSKIGLFLDVPIQSLERVVYFGAFIVSEINQSLKEEAIAQIKNELKAKEKEIKDQETLKEFETKTATTLAELENLKPLSVISETTYYDLSLKYGHVFEAGIGAEAIRWLLEKIDLKQLKEELEKEIKDNQGAKQEKLIRRLKLVKNFIVNKMKPEWMILKVLPIIPPDLRPMVPLDGGRYATSDLNDLYRRIINRNNRLKQLLELNAPEVIVRNEKRMLQEAVDALIDNKTRKGKATLASTGQRRTLKSLADMLRGKEGRFRQNLLGKRTDYSGRSVIVVGPELKLHQCGLPKKMALELFKPFVMGRLIRDGIVHNIRSASRFIETGRPEIWQILEEVVSVSPVFLNRAPTLHRLGIQAFYPVLIEGRAIRIHPLVCPAFNADFDGDQMAVHVPLTEEAKEEAKNLMLSTHNLLKPATGDPVVTPTQDLVWGIYYITRNPDPQKNKKPKILEAPFLAKTLFLQGILQLNDPISIPTKTVKKIKSKEKFFETTAGRIIFNEILPEKIPFQNEPVGKSILHDLIKSIIDYYGFDLTAKFLDTVKEMGLSYLTLSGSSWGIDDLPKIPEKKIIVDEAEKKIEEIRRLWGEGYLTDSEKKNKSAQVWIETKDKIVKLGREAFDPLSSVLSMVDSGARGSWTQLTQIIGMKGLVTNPSGEIIELPVKSSFREGFSVLEYFISSHGARKGLSDTALRTANAGYLTRRLVDVSQDVVVRTVNCKDTAGFTWTAQDAEELGKTLADLAFGRYLAKDILDDKKKVIVKKGELVDEKIAQIIRKNKTLKEIALRTLLTCKTSRGICQKCYGNDLGKNALVNLGTAVGIVAAQSIGEPGTQLTMRTFHTGGVVGLDITQGLPRVEELFEARPPKRKAILATMEGIVKIEEQKVPYQKTLKIQVVDQEAEFPIPPGLALWVKDGEKVSPGDQLTEGSLDLHEIYRYKGREATCKYLIKEIQNIYSSQGQKINNKHLETILRQMFSRVYVTDAGDTVLMAGEIAEKTEIEEENARLEPKEKKAKGEELLLGVTRVSLTTRSFLSAASFQETSRVLTNSAITGKVDRLEGLKENVIIGRKIPAGTGYVQNQNT